MNNVNTDNDETGKNEDADPEEINETGAEDVAAGAEEEEPSREEVLAAEIADLKDQLLRALAETENLRGRAERERKDAARYGATGFARDILAVADNLRRAIDSVPVEARDGDSGLRTLLDGVELTERELLAAFEQHGIQKIDPGGEKFNHDRHQAMFEVPGTGQSAGTVVEVLQPGYMMHDRLLRPAMVGVAKDPPKEGEETPHLDTTA